MIEFIVLSRAGDETLAWDPNNAEESKAAAAKFAELAEQGYEFYEVAETRGRRVTEFSPSFGRLIAAPGGRSKKDKKAGARPHAMSGGPMRSRG